MFTTTLPFIITYIESLVIGLKYFRPHRDLSGSQINWLRYCLMGILLTNTVCWAAFERVGLGGYSSFALPLMFRSSDFPWSLVLASSVRAVLSQLGISVGSLVLDDTDHQRAKQTTTIYGAHKVFDKKTGGYYNGQSIVFLLLVMPLVSIPVGFRFYQPEQQAWQKEEKRLKAQGIKKKDRPARLGS